MCDEAGDAMNSNALVNQYIYVMRSDSWPEDQVKIGMSNDPQRRVRDLYNTSMASPPEIVRSAPVTDMRDAEAAVFDSLADYRVTPAREFFRGPLSDMLSVFDKVARDYEPVSETERKRREEEAERQRLAERRRQRQQEWRREKRVEEFAKRMRKVESDANFRFNLWFYGGVFVFWLVANILSEVL